MNKSNTAKVQYMKASNSSRQRQVAFSQYQVNKSSFDGNKQSQDDLTDLQNGKFTLHEIKNRIKIALIDFTKTHMKIVAINEDTFRRFQEISETPNIHKMFQNTFINLRKVVQEQVKLHLDQKEVFIAVRGKQSTRIKITKQQDPKKKTKTAKQLEQLQKAHQQVKKQLFYIKEEKNSLQKRIMGLIQQFKTRKSFYVAQIKKLTDIISMSPFDIRKLVLTKTKQAKELQQKQQKQKYDRLSNMNFESPIKQQINIIEPRRYANGVSFNHKRQESIAYQSDYNTEGRPLKNVTSIQHLQEQKSDIY